MYSARSTNASNRSRGIGAAASNDDDVAGMAEVEKEAIVVAVVGGEEERAGVAGKGSFKEDDVDDEDVASW